MQLKCDRGADAWNNLRISHINVLLTGVGQHVPLKINMGFAKIWIKSCFLGENVCFHMKELRTALICFLVCVFLSFFLSFFLSYFLTFFVSLFICLFVSLFLCCSLCFFVCFFDSLFVSLFCSVSFIPGIPL